MELAEEEAIDRRRRWAGGHVWRRGGSAVEEGDGEFWVGGEAELAHEVCHAHALWWC